jgi:uncharacterized protein (TIGR02246 family)
MIRGLTRFLLLITFAVSASLARADDCEALRSVFEKWVAAYANHDLTGTMSIFADDVNFSFQGSPDGKKADLEKGYRDEFAKPNQAKWVPKFEEFYCSGNLGFVRSTWRLEVTNADGKAEIKAENRSVDILRRSDDGSWKIFRSLNYPVSAAKK